MTRRLGAFSGILVAALLATAFGMLSPKASEDRFEEKANLALRRTVHQLLRAAGDTTSPIPPVIEGPANTFNIQISRAFNYDHLPTLLQASLNAYEIRRSYDVAVRDCATEALQLGYTFSDLSGKQGVPCGGRVQKQGCYILQVTFVPSGKTPYPTGVWYLLGAVSLLGAGLFIRWGKGEKQSGEPKDTTLVSKPGVTTSDVYTPGVDAPKVDAPRGSGNVSFGGSVFVPSSQLLISGGLHHSLTYREAKLLRFFLTHANTVLERDVILKEVWEDEGVTVGRSVDVFVSRLRKLLQNDPAVQFKAVHGVGYRFEIN